MNRKRLLVGLASGAILGVFCIIGASVRYPEAPTTLYLFSFWFNRVLMGLVIGLLPSLTSHPYRVARGLFIGLFVSFAFYSATSFYDLMGFIAGGIYGIIIEYTTSYFDKN